MLIILPQTHDHTHNSFLEIVAEIQKAANESHDKRKWS